MHTRKWDEQCRAAQAAWLTERELALWAWALGDVVGAGVPILESVKICKEVFPHPRLSFVSDLVHNGIRNGDSFMGQLRNDFYCGLVDPVLVDMLDVGEETGELDKMLLAYAKRVLRESSATLGEAVGRSSLLMRWTNELAFLLNAGLPLLRSIVILENLPSMAAMQEATAIVAKQIRDGKSLSVALSSDVCHDMRADRMYRSMIAAGESGKVLPQILSRLVAQHSPLR